MALDIQNTPLEITLPLSHQAATAYLLVGEFILSFSSSFRYALLSLFLFFYANSAGHDIRNSELPPAEYDYPVGPAHQRRNKPPYMPSTPSIANVYTVPRPTG